MIKPILVPKSYSRYKFEFLWAVKIVVESEIIIQERNDTLKLEYSKWIKCDGYKFELVSILREYEG